jgi:peptidyl-prolyl cis-trans isomerase A (cyclophilin A)
MNRASRRLAAASAFLCLGLGLVTACGSDSDDDSAQDPGATPESSAPATESPGSETPAQDALGGPASVEPTDVTSATLHTSEGDIALTLYPEQAPLTVTNFVGLADGSLPWAGQQDGEPLYNGTIFHRVIDGFMIQGGDPEGTGMGGPGYQFEDEFVPELTFDEPYLLAMANSGPGTNGSQFFITVAETPHLNGAHTIFGDLAVVDAIAGTETDPNDRPVEDVVIESITVGE